MISCIIRSPALLLRHRFFSPPDFQSVSLHRRRHRRRRRYRRRRHHRRCRRRRRRFRCHRLHPKFQKAKQWRAKQTNKTEPSDLKGGAGGTRKGHLL